MRLFKENGYCVVILHIKDLLMRNTLELINKIEVDDRGSFMHYITSEINM